MHRFTGSDCLIGFCRIIATDIYKDSSNETQMQQELIPRHPSPGEYWRGTYCNYSKGRERQKTQNS